MSSGPQQAHLPCVLFAPCAVPITGAVDAECRYCAVAYVGAKHLAAVPLFAAFGPLLFEFKDEACRDWIATKSRNFPGAWVPATAKFENRAKAHGLLTPARRREIAEHIGGEQPVHDVPRFEKLDETLGDGRGLLLCHGGLTCEAQVP